jgi:hypothetical protein
VNSGPRTRITSPWRGRGSGAGVPGASAVRTHMTSNRITDPEVLESRYPVRLERFEIRRSSGGTGRWNGGGGLVRQYRFLKPVEVSLLTQRRLLSPLRPRSRGGRDEGEEYQDNCGRHAYRVARRDLLHRWGYGRFDCRNAGRRCIWSLQSQFLWRIK